MIRQELIETLNLAKNSCMYAFLHMMRVYSMYVHDAVKDNPDINMQRIGMLLMLRAEGDGVSQADIAQALCVKPSSVTSMLNNMEKDGVIIRKSDEKDKRIKRTYLTEKGIKTSEEVLRYIVNTSDDFFENFSEEENELYIQLIKKMEGNIVSKINKEREEGNDN